MPSNYIRRLILFIDHICFITTKQSFDCIKDLIRLQKWNFRIQKLPGLGLRDFQRTTIRFQVIAKIPEVKVSQHKCKPKVM